MKRKYPPIVTWFLLATFGVAFLFLILGSPPHGANDLLFWFMTLTVLILFGLCVMLHGENLEDERDLFTRVFFPMIWVSAVLMAAYAIWKHVRAGTL
jgi:hypothetical protein